MRKLLGVFLCISLSTVLSGQTLNVDSLVRKNFYLGVQSNQLVNQFLNFGGGSGPVNNPYLINLSMNNRRNGWGMNVGFGFTVSQSSDGDDFNSRKTNQSDLNLRLGADYKKYVTKRLALGYGIDILVFNAATQSETENRIDFNQRIKVTTSTTDIGWGFGPRGTLMFHLTDKLVIGTETTYYSRFINTTNNIETFSRVNVFNPNTGGQSIQESRNNTEDKSKNLNLSLQTPTVIYLLIRF